MVKHKNGVKTKALTDAEKEYLISHAKVYSCVKLAQRVGISRHLVQKFLEKEHSVGIKIKKPRRRCEENADKEVYFNPHERQIWI